MHRHPRLVSATRRCGRRYFGNATAAHMKTENQDVSRTVPSAKSWARASSPNPNSQLPHTTPRPSSSNLAQSAPKRTPERPSPTSERGAGLRSRLQPVKSTSRVEWSRDTSLTKWNTLSASDNTKRTQRHDKIGLSSTKSKPDAKASSSNLPSAAKALISKVNANQSPTLATWNDSSAPLRTDDAQGPRFGAKPSPPKYLSRDAAPHLSSPSSNLGHPPVPKTTSTEQANKRPIPTYPVSLEYDERRDSRRRRDSARDRQPAHFNEGDTINRPLTKKKVNTKPKYLARRRREVAIPTTLTVTMLAKLLNIKLARLLDKMVQVGMNAEANYDYILSADYAALLAEEFGFNPVIDDEAAFDIYPPNVSADPTTLPPRPPVVTIMGHVDHGKTTLLDTLRSASVAKGEAGGITQHIGAFSVSVASQGGAVSGPRSITFLDTPGHAAFSAMRARGANVTDIVVLVVAADDGIMPQTKEVIDLLKKDDSQVDLVVAVNKVDKADADPDTVKKALMAEGVQLEEFGGDIPAVHVSGLTGEGLPDLVETLSAVAEVRDLRAAQTGPVYGNVLESNIHKGLGSVATVLIRSGCLKVGTHIISGTAQGKVRRMTDSSGKTIQSALPGMAVTVSGWKSIPKAGEEVLDGSEADIKKAVANRLRRQETEALQEDAEAINEARKHERDARAEGDGAPTENVPISGPRELKLVIKADVSGSCEALEGALTGIGNHLVVSKVISTGVGDITESDILMAKAANATIIAFSVSAPRAIQSLAARNQVPVSTNDVIYRLMEDVRSRIIDMLPKMIETKVTGEATVLQLFDITNKAKQIIKVAGCRVSNGVVEKQKFARVVRLGHVIHEGCLDTMRQLKKDITEARKGMECGLTIKDFPDLQPDDQIQMYEKIEKPGVI